MPPKGSPSDKRAHSTLHIDAMSKRVITDNIRLHKAISEYNAIGYELREKNGISDKLRAAKASIITGRVLFSTLRALGLYIRKEVARNAETAPDRYVEHRDIILTDNSVVKMTRTGRSSKQHPHDVYEFIIPDKLHSLVAAANDEIKVAMSV